jgi:hypothetical protein
VIDPYFIKPFTFRLVSIFSVNTKTVGLNIENSIASDEILPVSFEPGVATPRCMRKRSKLCSTIYGCERNHKRRP